METSGQSVGETEARKSEGTRWLELMDLGHIKDDQTGYEIDGKPVVFGDFHLICGDQVRPIIAGLLSMGPNHEKYAPTLEALKKVTLRYVDQSKQIQQGS